MTKSLTNGKIMSIVNKDVQHFINSMYSLPLGKLAELQKYALDNNFPIIDNETANFLSTMILLTQPQKILEVGCCIGFSACLMASLINDEGHVTTIDRYPLMIGRAKETFKNLAFENKITLIEGSAIDALQDLVNENAVFDFIFLDASKGQYKNFLPLLLQLLKEKGVLLADNVLQNGDIAKDRSEIIKDQRTIHKNMREYLQMITNTQGLQSSIIPIGDGLALTVKL